MSPLDFRSGLLVACALSLFSCATPTRETDALLARERDLPYHAEIANIPFQDQTETSCGPTTLSMALGYAGNPTPNEMLGREIFSPELNGTLQQPLIDAARRRGMMAVPVHGLENVLREITGGYPVIVFENLAFNWYPRWHYALVVGYDLSESTVILHTGHDERKHWDLRKFERSWVYGDYWGLVVLPPGKLSASASELENMDAGAALEDLGFLESARATYSAVLARWPRSLAARIGLGNVALATGELGKGIFQLRRAVGEHPESEIAKTNLAAAEKAVRQKGISSIRGGLRRASLGTGQSARGL